MIKGISLLRSVDSAAAYERLSGFFAALGFAPGKGWEQAAEGQHNDPGSSSHPSLETPVGRGASFLAPLGNLEIVEGAMPSTAPI